MKVIKLDLGKDYSEIIREAISVLKSSGVIIYPTDIVYGLGANALDEWAVKRIFKIKQRNTKPLSIIVKNLEWVKGVAHIKKSIEPILSKIWPGKYTAILPKRDIIPPIVTTGLSSVGVRIPDYPFTDQLLGKFGYPIISTSANISGQETTNDINKVIEIFSNQPDKPDLIIDAGILPPLNPPIVVDLTSDKPKILRVGASRPSELLKILDLNEY